MNPEHTENSLDESSVTMVDVLQEEHDLEEEYNAVLGASDEKCCTYSQGAIKRQALYSCLTCCPEARTDLNKCAGICLACSYRCHENHELVELYTKRNFRCDCPTEKISTQKCLLNVGTTLPQKCNSENLYNQNFQGLYCKCHRPYPDPERTTEEVMLQCTVCEDWFHLIHLDMGGSAKKIDSADICAEMVCEKCMKKHIFLQNYTGLALDAFDNSDEPVYNITAENNSLGEDHDNKLRSDLDKSISDIMHMNAAETASSEKIVESQVKPTVDADENTFNGGPEVKRQKIKSDSPMKTAKESCRRPKEKTDYVGGATFWRCDWREALCQCVYCLDLYKTEKVEYLLDPEDSAKSYEERGKKRGAIESTYEQGIRALASIGRVQQIDAITEYNRMKDKLKEYLQTFAASKKVVTEADINRFFQEIRSEKNADLGQPYLCR
nr:putative E3 ubiquitin-protein ligase UBR7 [Bactrocera oleae]